MADNTVMGKPCLREHSGLRYRRSRACVECVKQHNRKLLVANLSPEAKAQRNLRSKVKYVKTRDDYLKKQRALRLTTHGRAKHMLKTAESRSKKRGLQCTLTLEWLEPRLVAGTCEVSGLTFDFSRNGKTVGARDAYAPSLDRIDNDRGYEPGNCRVVLWALNTAFNKWGAEVFRPIAIAWLSHSKEATQITYHRERGEYSRAIFLPEE